MKLFNFINNMIYFNKLIDICINRQESPKVVDNYFVGTIRTSSSSQDILEVLIYKKSDYMRRFEMKIKYPPYTITDEMLNLATNIMGKIGEANYFKS